MTETWATRRTEQDKKKCYVKKLPNRKIEGDAKFSRKYIVGSISLQNEPLADFFLGNLHDEFVPSMIQLMFRCRDDYSFI